MKDYQKINNVTGWFTFLLAAFIYISTIEPTGSFWDCGEFIATAHKLEVGHPPGAPLFMMLAKVFITLGGNGANVKMIPIMVNILSALMSAFTILFLFWTITAMARKIIIPKAVAAAGHKHDDLLPAVNEYPLGQIVSVMAAGFIGAMAYAFTDSFWFSAVEGEVYASSSFFTAIVFWAIFKWDSVADEPHHLRYIILIAYLMGLSTGVHLLNLLTIPAMAFVYYFRKYKPTTKGIIYTSIIGCVLLGLVQYGVIQGSIVLGSKFELLFVNGFGLPFWSGFFFFIVAVIVGIVWGLSYTKKKKMVGWNTAILGFAFVLIGYSSFAMIVIRSQIEPPLDENNPDNVFNFVSYLNREQYGDRPLGYGQYYNAKVIDQKEGAMSYAKVEGESKYVEAGRKVIPVYEDSKSTIFPRMYSNQANHIAEYKKWADVKGDRTPTFGENLKFFFVYQIGEMYWRYFMWNYVGRQNDNQGPGGITKGNWLSGIKFIDEMRLGPQDKIPDQLKYNKARNLMYFLPFILGLIGMFYHFNRDKHDAWIVLLLFFFTGIAIVIYLNGPPLQPRERDYAYVGSTYAFAMWIGMGVLQIYEWLRRKMNATSAASLAGVICLIVPAVMAGAEWDDHDRSHRYTSRDFAADYLNSCAPNAIIFTNGDNDTFPLWYAQEVENVRTDVRVVNLSLLNTDWYINQLKRKYYNSDPIDISWSTDKYNLGRRDYVQYYDRGLKTPVELKEVIDFMGSDDPQAKARRGDEEVNYYPTKHFKLTVDSAAAVKSGTVSPENAGKIVKVMDWTIDQNYLMKNDLIVLNILANNNWKRPVYFATTVGNENFMNLEPYFQLEGLTYRIVPIRTDKKSDIVPGRVETGIMYDNVMHKFVFGNMNDPRVYLDENNMRMTTNFRINLGRLAEDLLNEGKRDSAVAVLDKCIEITPDTTIPYNYFVSRIGELYYRAAGALGQMDSLENKDVEFNKKKELIAKGNAIITRLADIYENNLNYYISLKNTTYFKYVDSEMQQALYIMQACAAIIRQTNQKELADKVEKRFRDLAMKSGFEGRGGE